MSSIAKKILADALQIGVDEISSQTNIYSTEAWDSLAHMRIALALQEKLNRDLSAQEILQLENLETVSGILKGG